MNYICLVYLSGMYYNTIFFFLPIATLIAILYILYYVIIHTDFTASINIIIVYILPLDYMRKLRLIDELTYKINESEDDKKTIKKTLESIQDECSKLTYKLKTSARLLDEVKIEKEKLEIEKETMVSKCNIS